MLQLIQLFGAVLILIAFALAQAKRMNPHAAPYLLLNFFGSLILAILAAIEYQWGFLLLEGVWAIVSAAGLIALLTRRPGSRDMAAHP